MVYRDGTDDEPLDFCVWTPDGRRISSNPMNNVRFRRKETVEKPKEDDLSKYYDYECDNIDVDNKEEEKDIGVVYARIACSALAIAFISGSIGIGIDSGILLGIAILSFVVMFIFAMMGDKTDIM